MLSINYFRYKFLDQRDSSLQLFFVQVWIILGLSMELQQCVPVKISEKDVSWALAFIASPVTTKVFIVTIWIKSLDLTVSVLSNL